MELSLAHNVHARGPTFTRIAVVALVHVFLVVGLLKTLDVRHVAMPKLIQFIEIAEPVKPQPQPEPPKPMEVPDVKPPELFVPPVEIAVQPLVNPPPTVTATTSLAPESPATPTPAAGNPAQPGTGALRTAVLAEGCAEPAYPAAAARNGESGTVSLALLIGNDGRVSASRIQSSSGSRILDRAAVAALSLCKFKPATVAGVAEPAWSAISYVWNLEG